MSEAPCTLFLREPLVLHTQALLFPYLALSADFCICANVAWAHPF